MKPFLVLQLRPEPEASDNEFDAILKKGGLTASETRRIRLDQEALPNGLELLGYAGVIVGGGPACVSVPEEEKSAVDRGIEAAIHKILPAVKARDFPYLGCCYGIGILAKSLGASVSTARYGECVGAVDCSLTPEGQADRLLKQLPSHFQAFVGHKEALQELPEGCVHLVTSVPCPYQMIRYKTNVYATQFHPEADGEVFAVRIRIYKEEGYFPSEAADRLTQLCRETDVHVPELILRSFVDAYRDG
jgi:GMP synthase (glutamine-hydrolysing)